MKRPCILLAVFAAVPVYGQRFELPADTTLTDERIGIAVTGAP